MARKHNYVVGYEGEGQCIYGKDYLKDCRRYSKLFTFSQAVEFASNRVSTRAKQVVFKLVKVWPKKKRSK
jgi:hypothetical protein